METKSGSGLDFILSKTKYALNIKVVSVLYGIHRSLMPVELIPVELDTIRAIDGIVGHCRRIAMDPQTYALNYLKEHGEMLADNYGIGAITGSEFLLRFTEEELYGVQLFAQSADTIVWPELPEDWDPDTETNQDILDAVEFAEQQMIIVATVAGLLKKVRIYPNIRLDAPDLVDGMGLLVSLGLITAERMGEILYYQRPEI